MGQPRHLFGGVFLLPYVAKYPWQYKAKREAKTPESPVWRGFPSFSNLQMCREFRIFVKPGGISAGVH